MIEKKKVNSSKGFAKGLVTRSDIFQGNFDQSPNSMNIKWNFDGSIQKRPGCSSSNTVALGGTVTGGWLLDQSGLLSTGIISYWSMDDPTGGRFDKIGDCSLNEINTVGSITGIRSLAANFVYAESDGLLCITKSNNETGAIDFSFNTWIYLNSTSTTIERTILGKRDAAPDGQTVALFQLTGSQGTTNFTDSSIYNLTITTSGNPYIDTGQTAVGLPMMRLTGTNAYILTTTTSGLSLGTQDFTVEGFAILSRYPSGTAFFPFFDLGDYASHTGSALGIRYNGDNASPGQWTIFAKGVNTNTNVLINTLNLYHLVLERYNNTTRFYINGKSKMSFNDDTTNYSAQYGLRVGDSISNASDAKWAGWISQFRISKGIARYGGVDFDSPTQPFGIHNYEHWLYVNTNNYATFRVSSNGTVYNGTVQADSFGALNTATWYNINAWHSNGTHIGISVNLNTTTAPYTSGVRVGSAPLTFGFLSGSYGSGNQNYYDGCIDETGFWKKCISRNSEMVDLYGGGTGNTYSAGASNYTWSMFDFGASAIRWVTIAAGTGIYASSNCAATFVVISTTRTATYQYLDRSKNVLIATSDAYDVPLFWNGSTGTYAMTLAPDSAPAVKYSINYQGFLILLNSQLRKRGFWYVDENLQLTEPYTDTFDIPSTADDEITSAFVLNKFLYVSTKYKIYRVAFVGGNPDWSYLKIKDFGFVPRTVKLVSLKGGQVAVGLDWQRRMRVFDGGFDDLFLSNDIENDNKMCDFAMKKISLAGSGLVLCHAELDPNEQEYRLNVAIGADSTQTTHAILVNARSLSMYPYANQQYQAMCVAESANKQFLLASDRSGFIYILNSGNLDISTPIDDIYDSSVSYGNSPISVTKLNQANFFFEVRSCGTIYYKDRVDLESGFTKLKALTNVKGQAEITGAEQVISVLRTKDIQSVQNVYQFALTSSMSTAEPWKLVHYDVLSKELGIGLGNNG